MIRSLKPVFALGLCLLAATAFAQQAAPAKTDTQTIRIDLAKKKGALKPIWAFFGYDEPNFTYMKDGRKLLTELSALSPVPVYVRAHNLLTTGDGTPALKWGSTNAYTEDGNGQPVYNWRIVDSIFDTYVKRGMKPIAEIGFMPKALSTKPDPYQHHWTPSATYNQIYTGWAYPPSDYKKWGEVVYQWVRHCVSRYGEKEVQSWWWEVWNEPDIGYWQGTPEEYFKLYDFAADAVKRACPAARIGGPTTTSPRAKKAADFLRSFLEHCATGTNYASGKKGAPLDYISFHAKGSPKLLNGFVRMDMSVQLLDVYRGFELVAGSPFKSLPIIIGECDPEGCAACSVAFHPQNAYRNGTMYSSYTAASYARLYDLAEQAGVHLEGAVSWSFEFENQPWFAGFRDLATNGVDKPVLNVFRLFGKMKGNRLEVQNDSAFRLQQLYTTGVHEGRPDINALASGSKNSAWIMVWNYYDDDLPAPPATVCLQLQNLPASRVSITEYRVDEKHSNAYTVWKEMGSPQQVTDAQYALLEKAGGLQQVAHEKGVKTANGSLRKTIALPRQAVSLFELTW